MTSVFFDPTIGGDGTTVSDDKNPLTGLAAGGYIKRFLPALANIVSIGNYVKSVATGLPNIGFVPCRLATTGNDSLSGLSARDGVTPVAGDRVFVAFQSSASANGIYIAAAGSWTRATDADTSAEFTRGKTVVVMEGTLYGDTVWMHSTDSTVTLGTTALTFEQLPSKLKPNTWNSTQNYAAAVNFSKGANVASSATPDIWSGSGNLFHLTGSTQITGVTTAPQAGASRTAICDGEIQLINGANFVLPSGQDYKTQVNDILVFYADTTTKIYVHVIKPEQVQNKAMLNGTFTVNDSAGARTLAIKHITGNDPSPARPVFVMFRDPVLANGGYNIRALTSALSITIPSGATLGVPSNIENRMRLYLIDSAGSLKIGVYNSVMFSNSEFQKLKSLNTDSVASTIQISTAADYAHILYSDAAYSNLPVKEIGWVQSKQSTAGVWSGGIVQCHLTGIGSRNVGDVIQKNWLAANGSNDLTTSSTTEEGLLSLDSMNVDGCNLIATTASLNVGHSTATGRVFLTLNGLRGTGAGSQKEVTAQAFPGSADALSNVHMFHAFIANAASISTGLSWSVNAGSGYINRTGTNTNSNAYPAAVSSVVTEEIFT